MLYTASKPSVLRRSNSASSPAPLVLVATADKLCCEARFEIAVTLIATVFETRNPIKESEITAARIFNSSTTNLIHLRRLKSTRLRNDQRKSVGHYVEGHWKRADYLAVGFHPGLV